MGFNKLTTDDAKKRFTDAEHFLKIAKSDPNDTTSENFAQAIDRYFGSIASAQIQIISGLNDLLDRVDKLQQKLGR